MSTASALSALARLIRLPPGHQQQCVDRPGGHREQHRHAHHDDDLPGVLCGVALPEDREVRRRSGGNRGVHGPDGEDVPGGHRAVHVVEERLVLAEQDRGEPGLHHLLEGLGDHLADGDEPGGHCVEGRCRG